MNTEDKTKSPNKNRVPSHNVDAKKLQLTLICWAIGNYTVDTLPKIVREFQSFYEISFILAMVTVFITIPGTFLEIGLSQYSRRGCIKIWDAAPVWRGAGIVGVLCVFLSSLGNLTLSTYLLFYSINGLSGSPPWLTCGKQDFKKVGCYTYETNRTVHEECVEQLGAEHCRKIRWRHSTGLFWHILTTARFGDEDSMYEIDMLFCAAVILLVVYMSIRNGLDSLTVFVPFFVYCPTVLQAILLVKSYALPGSFRALTYIYKLKFNNIGHTKIWSLLYTFSLHSIGYNLGGLQTFGKYKHFRSATNLDAVMLNVINLTYTLLYALFIYNILGIFTFHNNFPYQMILDHRADIRFVFIVLGINFWDMSKMYSIFYFFSMFLIVLRNFATKCEVILSALTETDHRLEKYRNTFSFLLCIIHYSIFILSKYTNFGNIIISVQYSVAQIVTPILAFYSSVFICCFYGINRYSDDIQFMLGFKPTIVWQLSWYTGAIFGFIIFIDRYIALCRVKPPDFVPSIIVCTVFSALPLVYFVTLVVMKWQKKTTIIPIFKPTKDWGPPEEILRRSREMFSAHDMTKEYLYRQKRLKIKQ